MVGSVSRSTGRVWSIRPEQRLTALLVEQAAAVSDAAQALASVVRLGDDPGAAEIAVRELARQSGVARAAIGARLDRVFLVPYDRHAVISLAGSLDECTRSLARVARLLAIERAGIPAGTGEQADRLAETCAQLLARLRHPSKGSQPSWRDDLVTRARAVRAASLRGIFEGATDIRDAIIARDVHNAIAEAFGNVARASTYLEVLVTSGWTGLAG